MGRAYEGAANAAMQKGVTSSLGQGARGAWAATRSLGRAAPGALREIGQTAKTDALTSWNLSNQASQAAKASRLAQAPTKAVKGPSTFHTALGAAALAAPAGLAGGYMMGKSNNNSQGY